MVINHLCAKFHPYPFSGLGVKAEQTKEIHFHICNDSSRVINTNLFRLNVGIIPRNSSLLVKPNQLFAWTRTY